MRTTQSPARRKSIISCVQNRRRNLDSYDENNDSNANSNSKAAAHKQERETPFQAIELFANLIFYSPLVLFLIGTAFSYVNYEQFDRHISFRLESADAVFLDWSMKLTDLFLESPLLNDAMSYFSNPQCSMFPVVEYLQPDNYNLRQAIKLCVLQLFPYIYITRQYYTQLHSGIIANILVFANIFVDCFLYDTYVLGNGSYGLFASLNCNILSVQIIFWFLSWLGPSIYTNILCPLFVSRRSLTFSHLYFPSSICFVNIGCALFLSYIHSHGIPPSIPAIMPFGYLIPDLNLSFLYQMWLIIFIKEWIVSSYFGGLKRILVSFVHQIYYFIAGIMAGFAMLFLAIVFVYNGIFKVLKLAKEAAAAFVAAKDTFTNFFKFLW